MKKHPHYSILSSLKGKVSLSMIILICIIMIIFCVLFYRLSNNLISDIGLSVAKDNISTVSSMLRNYAQAVDEQVTQLIRHEATRYVIETESLSEEEISKYQRKISAADNQLSLVSQSSNSPILQISMYCDNGFSWASTQDDQLPFYDYESCRSWLLQQGCLSEDNQLTSDWCVPFRYVNRYKDTVYSVMNVRFLYEASTLKQRGLIITLIDENELYQYCGAFSSDAALVSIWNGAVLSSSDKSMIGQTYEKWQILSSGNAGGMQKNGVYFGKRDGDTLFLYTRVMKNSAYYIIPINYVYSFSRDELQAFFRLAIIIAVSVSILSVFIVQIISRRLTASLDNLHKTVRIVYSGNLKVRFTPTSNDEVSYLGEKINDMLDAVDDFYKIQAADAKAKKDLQIKLLQSQINPHLLYNTLDTAVWALKNQDTTRAQELLEDLSNFFRLALSGGDSKIPLSAELEMISHYIRIQRTARGMDIRLTVQIPEELNAYQLPKMTLQPIVENAILHGFSGFQDYGKLEITAERTEKGVLLFISDNGVGITPEDVERLNAFLQVYPPKTTQKHFGLYNVNRRLINTFGPESGLCLESEFGEYTTIKITIQDDFSGRR